MSELDSEMWDREYPTEAEMEQAEQSLYEEDEIQSDEDDDEYELDEMDELFSDDDEDSHSLIGEAKTRIEQARLYELLLEHDLFDGVDAIPQVVSTVQKEIKNFIEERYLILSGVKSEREAEVHHVIQEPQFNDLEVKVIKKLALKVSKGMTENAPTSEPEVSELNVVKPKAPQKGLNTLGKKKKAKKKSKPLRKQPTKKAIANKRKIKKEMAETSTKDMTAEEVAKRDIKYIESLKNMTKEEADQVVAQRHGDRRSKQVISQEAVNGIYSNRMAINETANHFSVLLAAAKKK